MMVVMLAVDWPTSMAPFTNPAGTGALAKSIAIAFVVMPAVSVISGIC
jgi:hypothetical protein